MYNKNIIPVTSINVNEGSEGETIEMKIERIVNNNEPITDSAPIIYTERKDGVDPAHDIRTDVWEIAADAMDVVTKTRITKRENNLKAIKGDNDENKEIGGPEPIQGKS